MVLIFTNKVVFELNFKSCYSELTFILFQPKTKQLALRCETDSHYVVLILMSAMSIINFLSDTELSSPINIQIVNKIKYIWESDLIYFSVNALKRVVKINHTHSHHEAFNRFHWILCSWLSYSFDMDSSAFMHVLSSMFMSIYYWQGNCLLSLLIMT